MCAFTTSLALGLRQLLKVEVQRVLIKSLAVTLVQFVQVATRGCFLIDWPLASGGLEDRLFAGAGALRAAL